MKPHPSITDERIIAMCERRMQSTDNEGICLACGADAEGIPVRLVAPIRSTGAKNC